MILISPDREGQERKYHSPDSFSCFSCYGCAAGLRLRYGCVTVVRLYGCAVMRTNDCIPQNPQTAGLSNR